MHNYYTYLALGDSYTLGESVTLNNNFPYLTVQLLRKQGFQFASPEIFAKTGWTTDELNEAIKKYKFLPKYDFVTLLAGVNDQFRGKEAEAYKMEYENLLKQAISLANDKKEHVVIISIPDYSLTPFSSSLDKEKIAKEIDIFNNISKALSIQYKILYLDITSLSRETSNSYKALSPDMLHPSAEIYGVWAEKLVEVLIPQLK